MHPRMASLDSQLSHGSTLHSGSEQTQQNIPRPTTSPCSTFQSIRQHNFVSAAKQHLFENVRPSLFAEIELLILTFCTGIQDVVSFPDYHCFASNQTGNTVLLSMALILPSLDNAAFSTVNTAIALSLFLAGVYSTGQLSHLVGPRRRFWLILCNALQTLLITAAATLQYVRGGMPQPHSLALMAFASGSQVVQSRSLAMTEISTAMATAAWVDLLMDPRLMVVSRRRQRRRSGSDPGGGNRPRNRRLAFLVALVAGSLVGAGILRTAGSAVALFVSAGGKAVVTGMFFFNGAEKQKQQEEAV